MFTWHFFHSVSPCSYSSLYSIYHSYFYFWSGLWFTCSLILSCFPCYTILSLPIPHSLQSQMLWVHSCYPYSHVLLFYLFSCVSSLCYIFLWLFHRYSMQPTGSGLRTHISPLTSTSGKDLDSSSSSETCQCPSSCLSSPDSSWTTGQCAVSVLQGWMTRSLYQGR